MYELRQLPSRSKPGLALTDVWTPRADQPDIEILTTCRFHRRQFDPGDGKAIGGQWCSQVCETSARPIYSMHTNTKPSLAPSTPNTIPGATMFTMSRAVFSDLKAGRPATLTFYEAE